uniref:zinc ribbon domain-containing protein n=1 Tax=Scytonema sp. PCC 10023 TaxID=1680591 RepID=UPI0039C737AD
EVIAIIIVHVLIRLAIAITYKIESKGGLMIMLPTKDIKPSQRCPKCGAVHKEWAELSNRHHLCLCCGFDVPRDAGSAMVMYNVVTKAQPVLGTNLDSLGCLSSTSKTGKRKNTGSMKQLGQVRRHKSSNIAEPGETPSAGSGGVVHSSNVYSTIEAHPQILFRGFWRLSWD